jgi:hypothetical protein
VKRENKREEKRREDFIDEEKSRWQTADSRQQTAEMTADSRQQTINIRQTSTRVCRSKALKISQPHSLLESNGYDVREWE